MILDKDLKYKATRDAYGDALLTLDNDPRVIVLDADLSGSTQTNRFALACPSRFINVGCAEQNLIGVASGLAMSGKIPFTSTYSMFCMRAWEQIRNTIAHDNLPVKIAVSHSGFTNASDGASHQLLEDLAIMRVIPNMSVINPCDAVETMEVVISEISRKGPAYIRLNRLKTPIIFDDSYSFRYGKAIRLIDGDDIAIFATGTMLFVALEAANMLYHEKIKASVYNVHTIKPLDTNAIISAAKETGAIITIEEHSIFGGLGGAIAEVLSENYPVNLKILGVNDQFGESGEYEDLVKKFGLKSMNIVQAAKKLIKRKK
ncbi:transketolase family protein [Methanospirillum sp.]